MAATENWVNCEYVLEKALPALADEESVKDDTKVLEPSPTEERQCCLLGRCIAEKSRFGAAKETKIPFSHLWC